MHQPLPYDSSADTEAHINEVRKNLFRIMGILATRAEHHDKSKFSAEEKPSYDRATPLLKGMTYGSEEYRACLREMKPAIQHHYEHNSHHPEHFLAGIAGMTLIDVLEMFCDWYAATKRHNDGDFTKSINHNAVRFSMDPQLVAIFHNTAGALGWDDQSGPPI